MRSLHDYERWLEGLEAEVAVDFDNGQHGLIVQFYPDEFEPETLLVPRQRLIFPGYDTQLEIVFTVNSDLECENYTFDYRRSSTGELIWRKDKDPGHPPPEVHIHRDPLNDNEREPYEEVDLGEVFMQVRGEKPVDEERGFFARVFRWG